MPDTTTLAAFLTAIQAPAAASFRGPVNSGALRQDKAIVLEKAASLLGYQTFVSEVRGRKAERKSVPLGFERGMQAEAGRALDDARAMAAATLRTTNQLKQSGELDRLLDIWTAGLEASGPLQLQDMWRHVENDPQARQVLKDQGLTDEMWSTVGDNMRKVEGRVFVRGGKVTGELKTGKREQARTVTFARSATGMPRTVSDLLRRGQFERMLGEMNGDGRRPLRLQAVVGESPDLELADVILGGTLLGMQMMAQHKRKLEDTGVAAYAGNATFLIVVAAAILVTYIGHVLADHYCPKAGDSGGAAAACIIGVLLLFLGLLVLFLLLILLGAVIGGSDYMKVYPLPIFNKDGGQIQ